jgi:uncharacterized protein YqgC (DUF456 family)
VVWVAASVIAVCSLFGVALTIISLPGTWFMLLVAVSAKLLVPDIMPWWVVGVAAGFVLAAELADIVSSAVGAKAGGASKKGMTGALVGSLLGAIAGTVFLSFIPILGTIIGGVVGAALGAVVIERGTEQKTWKESGKAGAGAAVGRFASTFIKAGIAIAMGLVITTAAFWPYSSNDSVLQNQSGQPSGMIQPE